ncbi:tit1 [Candida oxycetoniae]|uniref:tRNA dimethylallyltransferase n=1 Tax=Candida oxycetoniae TaxID=497107 RepID=A0AAI9T0V1_9ASCO|nr:tit1 [Candida oxycetoniae]KAI3406808.2 tit1 [Candida oxycetoniae]
MFSRSSTRSLLRTALAGNSQIISPLSLTIWQYHDQQKQMQTSPILARFLVCKASRMKNKEEKKESDLVYSSLSKPEENSENSLDTIGSVSPFEHKLILEKSHWIDTAKSSKGFLNNVVDSSKFYSELCDFQRFTQIKYENVNLECIMYNDLKRYAEDFWNYYSAEPVINDDYSKIPRLNAMIEYMGEAAKDDKFTYILSHSFLQMVSQYILLARFIEANLHCFIPELKELAELKFVDLTSLLGYMKNRITDWNNTLENSHDKNEEYLILTIKASRYKQLREILLQLDLDIDILTKLVESDVLTTALDIITKGNNVKLTNKIPLPPTEKKHTTTTNSYKQMPDWLHLERHVNEITFLKSKIGGNFDKKDRVMKKIDELMEEILEHENAYDGEINENSFLKLRSKLKEFTVNNADDCLQVLDTVIVNQDAFTKFENFLHKLNPVSSLDKQTASENNQLLPTNSKIPEILQQNCNSVSTSDKRAINSNEKQHETKESSCSYKQIPDWLTFEEHVNEIQFLKKIVGNFDDKEKVMNRCDEIMRELTLNNRYSEVNLNSFLKFRIKLKEFCINNDVSCLQILDTVILNRDAFEKFETYKKEKNAQNVQTIESQLSDFEEELITLRSLLGVSSFGEVDAEKVVAVLDEAIKTHFMDSYGKKEETCSPVSNVFLFIRLRVRLEKLFSFNGNNTEALDRLVLKESVHKVTRDQAKDKTENFKNVCRTKSTDPMRKTDTPKKLVPEDEESRTTLSSKAVHGSPSQTQEQVFDMNKLKKYLKYAKLQEDSKIRQEEAYDWSVDQLKSKDWKVVGSKIENGQKYYILSDKNRREPARYKNILKVSAILILSLFGVNLCFDKSNQEEDSSTIRETLTCNNEVLDNARGETENEIEIENTNTNVLSSLRQLIGASLAARPLISIVGTTGVGKSQFSIELAKCINGEIINADSMQVYRGVDIVTNKHPVKERQGIPHHLIDYVSWKEEYFIHRFNTEAINAINDIHNRNKIPIVVGGTHYYLQTLLFKNKTMEGRKERELSQQELDILDGPTDTLFQTLQSIDPTIACKFHPQDHRKLRRALEIWFTTGVKPSIIYHEQKLNELKESSLKYNTIVFWLYSDMPELYKRLDARVDTMMQTGAIEEIKALYQSYKAAKCDCSSGIYQVIGFKEFLPWLETESTDVKVLDSAFNDGVERMKTRTRQYAKYQVKWIQKTLSLELQKEAKFDFINGGKLCILDATDLTQWDQNVRDHGIRITKQFLNYGSKKIETVAPQNLEHLMSNDEKHLKSNKKLGAESNWKHFQCDICKDKSGRPLVAVGEENWNLHLNSRKHRRQLHSLEKKKHVEEMIRLRKENGALNERKMGL